MAEPPAHSSDRPPARVPRWASLHLWQIQPVRDLLVLAGVLSLIWLGSRLSIVTVPLLLALALAYLVEPVVRIVTARRRISRAGVALGIIAMFTLAVIVPALLGVGFAAAQGVQFARTTSAKVELVLQSIDKPDDELLRARLPSAWRSIRDYLVEQRRGMPMDDMPSDGPAPTQDATPPHEPAVRDPMMTRAPSPAHLLGFELTSAINWVGKQLQENAQTITTRLLEAGGGILGTLIGIFGSIGRLLFTLFLTAFFFYFLCTGFGKVQSTWHQFVPHGSKSRTVELLTKMDRVIAAFIRGRVTVCASMIVVYTVGYWLIGVPAPFVIGPLTGLLTLVPYAAGLTAPIAMLLMWLNPEGSGWQTQWWWILGGPLLILALAQALDDWVLTPLIQGQATGMATPLIVLASIAGGSLAGFYGLLLAIPVAACLKIMVEEIVLPRVRAWAQGRAPDLLPVKRE